MDRNAALEVFAKDYSETMTEVEFFQMLQKGLELLRKNPSADKLVISRLYGVEDQKAINIALSYNEKLMVRLLLDSRI